MVKTSIPESDADISTADLCRILSVKADALNDLVGQAIVVRLSQGHYALETSVRNYIKFLKDSDKETATKQKSDLAAEKLRRAKSDADMSQLNFQIKSGELVPVRNVTLADPFVMKRSGH
jgi:phage terminase Nu1 subunit (DNA packaging protein)